MAALAAGPVSGRKFVGICYGLPASVVGASSGGQLRLSFVRLPGEDLEMNTPGLRAGDLEGGGQAEYLFAFQQINRCHSKNPTFSASVGATVCARGADIFVVH